MRRTRWSIAWCLSGYRATLLLYPQATREQFGSELLEVVTQRLDSIYLVGGPWAVCRAWPQLWLDAAAALGSEYLDCLSGHGRVLVNWSLGCLLVTAAVWTLIALCLVFQQTWMLPITEWSTPLTMTLAFGAPLIAVVLSRVGLCGASVGELRSRATFYASVAAAAGTWSVLLEHL
jgi:hypothetical protein